MGDELLHTSRQTDIRNEDDSRFSPFCECSDPAIRLSEYELFFPRTVFDVCLVLNGTGSSRIAVDHWTVVGYFRT